MPGDFSPTATHQEVKVATLVGLQHMVDIQLAVAADDQVLRRFQVSHARRQLCVGDVQVQATVGAVEFDPVTFLHRGQRSAGRGFRRHVQDHGAVGGAAHARIGDPHHIGHALGQQLGRQAHVADFGHAWVRSFS